jgi:hypothetical protein
MNTLSRSVLPLVLGTATAMAVACNAGDPAAPVSSVEATPSTIEPDDTDTIPCGPRLVLQSICQRCHTKPPAHGAPFPLVTRSNIVRIGPDGEIRLLMIEQLEMGRMPLTPVTIDYDSRETLLDWLHVGAPAEAPRSCDDVWSSDTGSDGSPRPARAGTSAGARSGDDACANH